MHRGDGGSQQPELHWKLRGSRDCARDDDRRVAKDDRDNNAPTDTLVSFCAQRSGVAESILEGTSWRNRATWKSLRGFVLFTHAKPPRRKVTRGVSPVVDLDVMAETAMLRLFRPSRGHACLCGSCDWAQDDVDWAPRVIPQCFVSAGVCVPLR